ncbi:MAG: HD domain-containing phosphohydrolase [Planctomycetota bacterium]
MARSLNTEDVRAVTDLLEQSSILAKNRAIYGHDHARTRKSFARVCHSLSEIRSRLRRVRRRLYVIRRQERYYMENVPLPHGMYEGFLNERLDNEDAGGLEIILDSDITEFEHVAALFADAEESRFSRFGWLSREKVFYLENRGNMDDGSAGIYDSAIFSIPELRIQEEHYLGALHELELFMDRCDDATPEELDQISGATNRLVDQLLSAPEGVVPLTTAPYHDSFTYYHSLNVCVLTLAAARKVVTQVDVLERIAQAALLHDLGKSKVPKEILYKPGRLTDSEAKVVRDHPVVGAALLQKMPTVDPLSVSVAFGHHIKDGGEGYPRVNSSFRLDPVTQLVEVVDIFEALTANRPYKKSMTARQAFEILYGAPDLLSFRPYVDLLFYAVGDQPVVSESLLDDEQDDSEIVTSGAFGGSFEPPNEEG